MLYKVRHSYEHQNAKSIDESKDNNLVVILKTFFYIFRLKNVLYKPNISSLSLVDLSTVYNFCNLLEVRKYFNIRPTS